MYVQCHAHASSISMLCIQFVNDVLCFFVFKVHFMLLRLDGPELRSVPVVWSFVGEGTVQPMELTWWVMQFANNYYIYKVNWHVLSCQFFRILGLCSHVLFLTKNADCMLLANPCSYVWMCLATPTNYTTTDLLQTSISSHGRGVPPRKTFLVHLL
jgi:hypothetical protein